MKGIATFTTIMAIGLGLTPAFAASPGSLAQAPAKLQAGVVYAYRGNPVDPEYTKAKGAHVNFVTATPTTIAPSPHGIAAVASSVLISCEGGNVNVTPLVPRIVLHLSKGHYRFAVKLPGVGTTVSATGVVESATLIAGTIKVSSPLCRGSYRYSATLDRTRTPSS
jgi:hypothetical protein